MTENEAVSPEPSKPEPSKPGERPRPRFGELAPEGWTWQPPEQSAEEPEQVPDAASAPPQRAKQSKPSTPRFAPPTTAPHHNVPAPTSPSSHGAGERKPVAPETLRVDRVITLSLLVFGLFGLFMSINTINSIPEALQMMHEQRGLADYVASESDMRTILVGTVLQGVLWAATAVWAWLRIRNARRAFWIPLVGGVTSAVLLFAVVSMVAANDPQFLELYGAL